MSGRSPLLEQIALDDEKLILFQCILALHTLSSDAELGAFEMLPKVQRVARSTIAVRAIIQRPIHRTLTAFDLLPGVAGTWVWHIEVVAILLGKKR